MGKIRDLKVILPPHPVDLESGAYFEIEIPEIDIKMRNYRENIKENVDYVQEIRLNLPNVSILCMSETFISYFPLNLTVSTPVYSPSSQEHPVQDMDLTLGVLSLSLSQEDYRLFLRLCDLNLAYDDCLDRLILPNSLPPTFTNPFKYLHLHGFSQQISVLFTSNLDKISEIMLNQFDFSVEMYTDGYLVTKFTSNLLEIHRPKEIELVEIANPFKFSSESEEKAGFRLPVELLVPKNELFEGKMLSFALRKDRFGNKTMTAEVSFMRFFIDLAFVQEIQGFFLYGFPDYSNGEIDNFAYLHENRPFPGQSHFPIEEKEWLSPLLDFEIRILESEYVLPRTGFTCTGNISYAFVKQNERKLQGERGLQIGGDMSVYVDDFCMVGSRDKGESSRHVPLTRVIDPIQVQYHSQMYTDLFHFPSEKIHGCESSATISDLVMTLSISDFHQLWKFYLHQSTLMTGRKRVIEELVSEQREYRRSLLEMVTQRQTLEEGEVGSESESQRSVKYSHKTSFTENVVLPPPRNTFVYLVAKLDLMIIDDTNGLYKSFLWVKGKNEEFKGEEDPQVYSQSLLRANVTVNLYNPVADV